MVQLSLDLTFTWIITFFLENYLYGLSWAHAAGFPYWAAARVPGGGRDHGLMWAQLILDSFEADENSLLHAKTSTYLISACGAAAHKSLRKSGSFKGQET